MHSSLSTYARLSTAATFESASPLARPASSDVVARPSGHADRLASVVERAFACLWPSRSGSTTHARVPARTGRPSLPEVLAHLTLNLMLVPVAAVIYAVGWASRRSGIG